MDKAALRRELLSRLRAIPEEKRRKDSATICSAISEDPAFLRAGTVFAFLALPGEPDLSSLIAGSPEKRWGFSRVAAGEGISFHEVADLAETRPGVLGLREPDPSIHPPISPDEAGLILVPGLGFDPESRARLGRGKGHYDRFLARALSGRHRPQLVGVAFSVQFTRVPVESHDIPMDRILTEKGWR